MAYFHFSGRPHERLFLARHGIPLYFIQSAADISLRWYYFSSRVSSFDAHAGHILRRNTGSCFITRRMRAFLRIFTDDIEKQKFERLPRAYRQRRLIIFRQSATLTFYSAPLSNLARQYFVPLHNTASAFLFQARHTSRKSRWRRRYDDIIFWWIYTPPAKKRYLYISYRL